MTPRHVREATPDDLPVLRAIQLATLAEPWPAALDLAVRGPPISLVYADPEPVGYALALPGGGAGDSTAIGDGPTPDAISRSVDPDARPADVGARGTPDLEGRDAYLIEIAVAAPRQGEGCGSSLLDALVDRLRRDGYDRLTVTARECDERAIEFYLARGFTTAARLPDHYESGDGRLLVRPLDP